MSVRRYAPLLGSIAAVLTVIAGVAVAVAVSSARGGATPVAATPTPGPVLGRAQLDRIARAAPCTRPNYGLPVAHQAQVRGFSASAVVLCQGDERRYPDGTEWQVVIRRVTGTGLAPLLSSLTQPDEHPVAGQACPAIGYLMPAILLANAAGKYLRPDTPRDSCGAPRAAATRAMAQLTWRTVSTTKATLQRSAPSVRTGCEMRWKNLALLIGPGRLSAGGPVLPAGTNLRVCRYRSAGDPEGGAFVGGGVLRGAAASRLRTALGGAGVTGSCPAQREFAVVSAPHGGFAEVELGGCWRVLRDDGNVGRARPATVRALLTQA